MVTIAAGRQCSSVHSISGGAENVLTPTVTPNPLRVTEGSDATARVRLSHDPGGTVIVSIGNAGGNLVDVRPTSLTFTSANWSVEQELSIHAPTDSDDQDAAEADG